MQSFHKKTAVITGAGSGIGQQLALQLAAAGAHVALADINKARLDETAETIRQRGGTATAHMVDVSKREQVEAFAEEVLRQHGQADILINNAGVTLGLLSIEEVSYEEMEWLIGINLWGVIYGTKTFLPHLKTRPEASLVNISSVFAFSGIPLQGPYVVSKFGIRGFTETLRGELLDQKNIHVMVVHPGGTKTNIARDARHRNMDKPSIEQFNARFDKNARTTAEDAARLIIRGIRQRKPRLVIGSDAKWMDRLSRFFPSKAVETFAKMTKRFDQGGDFF